MELPATDRRIVLWDKYGQEAMKLFKCFRTADQHVLVLIDMAADGSRYFAEKLASRTGKPWEEFEERANSGRPWVAIFPVDLLVPIFKEASPKSAARLLEPPPDGAVRVLVLSKGLVVMHAPLPVGTN